MRKTINANDTKIIELKKLIACKKDFLKELEKFQPATSCRLMLDGMNYDLRTCDLDTLSWLLLKLNAYRMSADDLGLVGLEIGGSKITDWLNDARQRRLILNKRQEEVKLRGLEAKLTDLLSDEKKTELIIDEVKGLI